MKPAPQTIITVFGRKGFGKTQFLRYYIHKHPSRDYIIFDHFHEHEPGADSVVIYRLSDFEHADPDKHRYLIRGPVPFEDFWDFAASCRGMTVVFDEVDKCCTAGDLPGGLNDIVQYGRHLDVSLLVAARRPSRVNRSVTSQSDFIVSYNLQEPRDLAYLAEFCGDAYARAASTLRNGECIIYPEADWQAAEKSF